MLEKLKGTFDKGVAAVSVKSESIVESSRTRTAMNNAQKSMDTAITALGLKLYNAWLAGSVDMADLEEDCKKIQNIHTEVASLQERLARIKEEESQILGSSKKSTASPAVFCSNCGKKLNAGARFCDECGTAVKP